MLDLLGNGRPAGDLLSRVVRVTLGGVEYELPVLTIAGNKRWREELGATLGQSEERLNAAESIDDVVAYLNFDVDTTLDLLISYDKSGVLPPRAAIEDAAYDDEAAAAFLEVWRAANPKARALLTTAMMDEALANASSPPTSSPPPSTAGRPKRSKKN